MSDYLTVFAFLTAGTFAFIAFTCWRKALSFHTLLSESANRIDALKATSAKYDKEVHKLQERLSVSKDHIQKLEKQTSTHKSKVDVDAQKLEERAFKAEEKAEQLDLRCDHLRTQVEVLTQQLREATVELKEMQSKSNLASRDSDKKFAAAKEGLEKELNEWRKRLALADAKLKDKENEMVQYKKLISDVDPEKLKEYQRKAAHFESLYKAMRGQREMSDERNRNWEVALKKLAKWILTQKGSRLDIEHAGLGPLVGEALEKVGEGLIQDEFSANQKPVTGPANVDRELGA